MLLSTQPRAAAVENEVGVSKPKAKKAKKVEKVEEEGENAEAGACVYIVARPCVSVTMRSR